MPFEVLLPNLFFGILAIALIAGIFHVTRRMPARIPFRYVGALVIVLGSLLFFFRHGFVLRFVPDALEVKSVAYSKEESMGFGPGANEAGVIVYPLPDSVARQIEQQGLAYFEQMPPNADQHERGWQGNYHGWQPTPVPPVVPEEPRDGPPRFDMLNYVCKYLHISVDPAIVDEVNAMLNSPGSYYAYSRIGMMVVSPGKRRVVYLYNG